MNLPSVFEKLLSTPAPAVREPLLAIAASEPNGVEALLEAARDLLNTAPQEALRLSDLAVEVAMRVDLRAAALAGRSRAQALRLLGRHEEAVVALDAAAARAGEASDDLLAAQIRIGLIDSLGLLGRHEEALALALRLQADLHAQGAEEDAARALVNAGSLHFRRDDYSAALECYQQALAVFEKGTDRIAIARTQANCANILKLTNRPAEALALYTEARAAFLAHGMAPAVTLVDANVGILQHLSGRYAAALEALTSARQGFIDRGQTLETAKCDSDLADVYRDLNLYPEARDYYERAIGVFEAISLHYERARAELGLAAVLMAMERHDDATIALDRAATIFRRQKNRLQGAYTRLMRAELLGASGRREEARREACAAARALARLGQPAWAAEARFLLIDLNGDRNATRSLHAIARIARLHSRGWLECRAERVLGLGALQRGNTRRALRHLRRAVAALEAARTLVAPEALHVAYFRDKQAAYEDLVLALLERPGPTEIAEAFETVERSRSRLLLERLQAAIDSDSIPLTLAPEAHARLNALREQLSQTYQRIHTPTAGSDRLLTVGLDSADALPALEKAYEDALQDAERSQTGLRANALMPGSQVSIEALQALLPADEVLIEFYIARSRICAFIIASDAFTVTLDIACLEDVNRTARRLRYALQKMSLADGYSQRHAGLCLSEVSGVLQDLYHLLLRPLEAQMNREKIVLIPHGVLHGLPFHAFFDGERHALDRWEFVYAPSAGVWCAGRQRPRSREAGAFRADRIANALLMGVPDPGIEAVGAEIEALGQRIPGAQVFCGQAATLAAFHAHAADAQTVHLATHALFRADNPLFSALRFADGWLLARDLYNITLNCDLATLSACRTGVAGVEPGDELFGLLRGFLCAGVRSVAASLWPADDIATTALMTDFYVQLASDVSKAAALRAAQRQLRDRFPHPFYWAAFALVGDRG